MKLTPAEVMHNRILNGTYFSTKDVTADDFEGVVQRAGTKEIPEVKRALEKLRTEEKWQRV